MRRRRARRGITLGLVISVVLLAVSVAFFLAAGAITNNWLASSAVNRAAASNLADSLLAQAAAAMLDSQGTFGGNHESLGKTINATNYSSLSFLPGTAPFSTNNMLNTSSAPGWGRQVPPNSADLAADVAVGGLRVRREALVTAGPYHWSIASMAPINSQGQLLIGAVASVSQLPSDLASLPAAQLLPSDLGTNSTAPAFAIALQGGGVQVGGNVAAAGGIKVPPGSVTGLIEANATGPPVPSLDLQQFSSNAMTPLSPPSGPNLNLSGFNSSPSLTLSGTLNLDNAVLYVNGNLGVGAITGKGAVFVTGSTVITAGAPYSATAQLVLGSQGDVTIGGASSAAESCFQGLIYTQGNFTGNNVTLEGIFLQNSAASASMQLTNCQVVGVPSYGSLGMMVQTSSSGGGGAASVTNPGGTEVVVSARPGGGYTVAFTGSQASTNQPITCATAQDAEAAMVAALSIDTTQATMLQIAASPLLYGVYNGAVVQSPSSDEIQMLLGALSAPAGTVASTNPNLPAGSNWAFDINAFVTLADRTQLKLWKDI